MDKPETLTMRVSEDTAKQVRALAAEEKRSVSQMACILLESALAVRNGKKATK